MAVAEHRHSIFVLRALGLGDLVTSIPAMRAIRNAYPLSTIYLGCDLRYEEFIHRNHIANRVFPCSLDEGKIENDQGFFDIAINLHGRGPESHQFLMDNFPAQNLWAFRNEEVFNYGSSPEWDDSEHEISRWCRLIESFGVAADASDQFVQNIEPNKSFSDHVIVHIGAGDEARRWPLDRWADVTNVVTSSGAQVILTGSPNEVSLVEQLTRIVASENVVNLAGQTSIMDLARTVAAACLVICGDTGISHLAFALNVPAIVLYGPTPPSLWGPTTGNKHHISIWKGSHASDPHSDSIDPQLMNISVSDVVEAIEDMEMLGYSTNSSSGSD